MKQLIMGVCEGRHEMPCASFIFNQEVNPLDVAALEEAAFNRIKSLVEEQGIEWEMGYAYVPFQADMFDVCKYRYSCEAVIYVTGLTVAVMAAVNAARALCESVVLMHYDRESGQYYPQKIG